MTIILLFCYILSSTIFVTSGVSAYKLDTKRKPNQVFLVLCLLYAWWSVTFGLMVSAPTTQLASVYNTCAVVPINLSYALLLHFVLLISGNSHLLNSKWKMLCLYVPGVISSIFYSIVNQPPENYAMTPFGWTKVSNIDMGFAFTWSFKIYCGIYLAATVFFLLKWAASTKFERERRQAAVILPSVIFVGIIGIFIDLAMPFLGIPLVPPVSIILMIFPILIINYVTNKYNLLRLSSQNLALEYIGIMNEGLLILDDQDRIVDMNSGFLQLMKYSRVEIVGRHISTVLSDISILAETGRKFDIETIVNTAHNSIVPVLLSYSVLTDQFGQRTGTVMIIQNISEIRKYQNELKNKVDELHNEIIIRKEAQEKIAQLAYYDQLTGLPNRRLFFDKLNLAVKNNTKFAVYYLDLDMFKNVNDTLGHIAGDELLKQVAKRFMTLSDDLATIARIGGDEFLFLSRPVTDASDAEVIAGKLLEIMKRPFIIHDNEIKVTASIGLSLFPDDSTDSSDLIKFADISLYRAKDQGKNRYLRYK